MPLDRNISRAREITASNLGTRLELPKQRDEIHDFSAIINDLLDRLQGAFEFQKKFISNASHEIRNPLTVIAGEAEIALSAERPAAAYRQSLEAIAHEAERLHQLVNSLLSLARTGGEGVLPEREEVHLSELLRDIREGVSKKHDPSTIKWPDISAGSLPESLSCNRMLFRSAMVNLIDNACKYDPSKTISVDIKYTAGQWTFDVSDKGVGIPESEVHLVTEPLYRATNARSFPGQGLGLAMVDRIIRWHDGTLRIESASQNGTRVTITLPT
jgi:signal transduction histidine kinase